MTDDNTEVSHSVPFGLSYLVSKNGNRISDMLPEINDTHPNIEGHISIANEIYTKLKKI
jgi:lysophospholipase L1-like esterase